MKLEYKQESMNTLHYVGVDVSKAQLDVSSDKRKACTVPNDSTSITKLLKKLPSNTCLIVESTGGYERLLIKIAHSLNLKWKVINPARVRAFALSKGQLAKTDPLDAALLREFGECFCIQPDAGLDLKRCELAELVSARDQMVSLKTQTTNFLEHAEGATRKIFNSLKTRITSQIKELDAAILNHIQSCQQLSTRYNALIAHKGVGQQIAAVLLAHLPQLGQANRQQISALAGVAPHPRDSGNQKGVRFIQGGRPRIRRALYMAVISSIRTKSPIAAFYRHLRDQGKFAKVAIIAAARKLLIYINSSFKNLPA